MDIQYQAPQRVHEVISSLGRTEDVRFSPTSRRIAVAAFARNRIGIFDVHISGRAAEPHVALTAAVELSSPALNHPHGVDFINEDTLIVSNREGGVAVFELPAGDVGAERDVIPLETWPAGGASVLQSPGSIAVTRIPPGVGEVLICNNSGNTVTRHLLDDGPGSDLRSAEVLLHKWLAIPDGVSVSPDRRWVAVSNHETHNVLLYQLRRSLSPDADPDGILRCVAYPHGLRFSADGCHLIVADAGAPYLHVYASDGGDWYGVRQPTRSIRIMDQDRFSRGRHNPQEGGPKGLDIDVSSRIVVVTCESVPLAFFDAKAILNGYGLEANDRALAYEHELMLMEERLMLAEERAQVGAELRSMQHSKSWRLTAPLRGLISLLKS